MQRTFQFWFYDRNDETMSVFNGHIQFRVQQIPSDLFETLDLFLFDIKCFEQLEVLSNPLARLASLNTEASLEVNFGSYCYDTTGAYDETQEYLMNIQTIQENIIFFNADYNLEDVSDLTPKLKTQVVFFSLFILIENLF